MRASVVQATGAAFDDLAASLTEDDPITSVSLRAWDDLPTAIAVLRQPPHESRADSVMYRQVVADVAAERGWAVHRFDARTVEAAARQLLGARADDVLDAPRRDLGPPWTKDHRQALAATVLAGSS